MLDGRRFRVESCRCHYITTAEQRKATDYCDWCWYCCIQQLAEAIATSADYCDWYWYCCIQQLTEAIATSEEQSRAAANTKRKLQRLNQDMSDLRLHLEEQTTRNADLEKKQRKLVS